MRAPLTHKRENLPLEGTQKGGHSPQGRQRFKCVCVCVYPEVFTYQSGVGRLIQSQEFSLGSVLI